MLSKEQTTKISKALSYVLRHGPSSITLEPDKNGWASVEDLLLRFTVDGIPIGFDVLQYIVETNTKKRFRFNEDFSLIRASQGHSIKIDLGYEEKVPPAVSRDYTEKSYSDFTKRFAKDESASCACKFRY